jgi:hypothetical protein
MSAMKEVTSKKNVCFASAQDLIDKTIIILCEV